MLRSSTEHSDTDLLTRRSALRGLAGMAATAFGAHPSRGADLPDNPFSTTTEFPYLFSPLEVFVRLEQELIPENTKAKNVIGVANRIAYKVKASMHDAMLLRLPVAPKNADESLRILATRNECMNIYMFILAKEIRSEGYKYIRGSGSFHDSMVSLMQSGEWPLDCDLLCHICLHIARHHNIPLAGMQSWGHMTLCQLKGNKVFDPSQMQTSQFIHTFEERRKEDRLSVENGKKLEYYQPMSEKMMRQIIAANTIFAMTDRLIEKDDLLSFETGCKQAEKLLTTVGPSNAIIHSICYVHNYAAQAYEKRKNLSDQQKKNCAHHKDRLQEVIRQYSSLLALTK